jgi:O-antigen ligase
LQVVLQIILILLFIFAALSYGAVHYWAYSIVFGIIFLLCALVLLQSGLSLLRKSHGGRSEGAASFSALKGPFMLFLAAFLALTLFQLVPLSGSVLKVISHYSAYLYGQAHDVTVSGSLSPGYEFTGYLSLDRDKTVKSLVTVAAYLGFAFLVTRTIRWSRDLNRFAVVLIVFSVGLSLYGLFSLLNASPKMAGWKNPFSTGARVSATLVNADHFAAYLNIAIYVTFGYLAAFLKRLPPAVGRSRVQRLLNVLSAEGSYIPKAFLLLFAMGVMVFVMCYTLSRGAVIGFCASILFGFILLFLKTRRLVSLLLMILPLALVGYYISVVGVTPLVERIEETRKTLLEYDDYGRILAYRAGLELWRKFPLFGSGLGTFDDVFLIVEPRGLQHLYYSYLENDWLQLAIETGWTGGVLFVLAICSLFARIVRRWWQAEGPWGFGFGLAAIGGIVGMSIHAFLDFGLRIPVNTMFLVLLVSLALIALEDGFEGKKRGVRRGSSGLNRTIAGFALLIGAVGCILLSLQVCRYGLAQYYCPTEIDTTSRRDYRMSAFTLQKALHLNPLNGDYWLNMATFVEIADENGTEEGTSVSSDGSLLNLEAIPGWSANRSAGKSFQEWAFAEALARSPAASGFWLALADHLWETLETDENRENGRLLERTTQCYNMAVELHPGSSAVRQRAAEFSVWLNEKDLPEP